ncbi:MAG: TCP-1/cpn60 chaperonin family protein, partial [Candidatus Poribacteria bacterium]
EKLQERLAKLSGGVAVINVGAATEVEMKNKKALIEDAMHAARAAFEEGMVPGGGVAYIRAQSALDSVDTSDEDEGVGVEIVRRALEEPLRQIVRNAGLEDSLVVDAVRKSDDLNYGYDARDEKWGDMFAMGVIDPTKVARIALEKAASIAGLMLTTEALIAEIPEKAAPMPEGPPGGGGMY